MKLKVENCGLVAGSGKLRAEVKSFYFHFAGPGRQPAYFLYSSKESMERKDVGSAIAIMIGSGAKGAALCRRRYESITVALRRALT